MYPHRIRLRGPWESEPLTAPDCATPRVRWRRRFGQPTRIDAHERVWLTVAGLSASAAVWLNGRLLRPAASVTDSCEFEITSLLAVRNEVVLELDGRPGGTPPSDVALEVRCQAFLRNLRFWTQDGSLHVAGEAIGASDRPLELYVLVDGSTAIYTTLLPGPEGQPFAAQAEWSDGRVAAHQVKVELVDGATAWHTCEGVVVLSELPSTFVD